MTIATKIYTWWYGDLVGEDEFGNRYYQKKGAPIKSTGYASGTRRKRWVMYNGQPEASKVPAEWHAWLHYLVDDAPEQGDRPRFDWQKEHLPNLTGTVYAYRPPGHILKGGQREKATGDYEAWTPS